MSKQPSIEELAVLTGGNNNPSSAQNRIAELLANKLEKELIEQAGKDSQEKAFREAHVAAARQQEADKEAMQAACPHMKPNFRPAIGGQKDHKGNFHFICQYCTKEFGNEIPYHLRIPSEMVGGPQ